jgi:hypothetical protein
MGLSKLSMLALAGLAAAELPPVHIKGQKFFYENGTQFFMKGIAYQQDTAAKGQTNDKATDYIDPLSNEKLCKRDVPLLEELGVNTIRTYAIDPEADHSACMKLLDEAGIYVISDLSQPQLSIKRDAPQWTVEHYERYTAVVDELAQYSNVLGFFAGNEVSDANNNTEASAYVKAALRDTKAHIKEKGYKLGVGYATNDHPDIRDDIANYFNCGDDEVATDFWGYNIYSWCGESDIEKSGYADWVDFYKDYNVPVFFAEYGCNSPGGAEGRKFDDTRALFSDDMTGVFSGGLVYMYHQEDNDYGVVEVKGDKAERMDNFFELKKAHKAVDPKGVEEDDYTPKGDRETCPEIGEVWRANTRLPPTPESELCKCAVAKSECTVGEAVKEKDFGEIFDYICDAKGELCTAIQGNGTTGIYGAYSMCDNRSKLTILLGLYYEEQGGAADACDFDGLAEVKKSSAKSSCDEALESASKVNEEAATATGAMSEGTGGADDEDFGVIGTPMARLFSIGDMAVGLYMVVALGVGATMVVL